MAIFDFVIFPSSLPLFEGFNIFEFESLDELEEALIDFVEMAQDATSIKVNFFPQAQPPFTIPDAFARVVDVLNDKLQPETIVRCEFRTAEIAAYATRHLPGNDLSPRKPIINGVDVYIVQVTLPL